MIWDAVTLTWRHIWIALFQKKDLIDIITSAITMVSSVIQLFVSMFLAFIKRRHYYIQQSLTCEKFICPPFPSHNRPTCTAYRKPTVGE